MPSRVLLPRRDERTHHVPRRARLSYWSAHRDALHIGHLQRRHRQHRAERLPSLSAWPLLHLRVRESRTVPRRLVCDVRGSGDFKCSGVCEPGHFCPEGSESATAEKCPAGTLNALAGVSDVSGCTTCRWRVLQAPLRPRVPRWHSSVGRRIRRASCVCSQGTYNRVPNGVAGRGVCAAARGTHHGNWRGLRTCQSRRATGAPQRLCGD